MSFTFSFFIVLLLLLNPMLSMPPASFVTFQTETLAKSSIVTPTSAPSNSQILAACAGLLLVLILVTLFGQSLRYWIPDSVANTASLQVSAGLILLLAALGMVFFSNTKRRYSTANQLSDNCWSLLRLFSPTAMMTVLLLSAIQPERTQQIVAALAAAMLVLTALLIVLKNIQNYRRFALVAHGFQILLGLILSVIAIDRMLTGLHLYFQHA